MTFIFYTNVVSCDRLCNHRCTRNFNHLENVLFHGQQLLVTFRVSMNYHDFGKGELKRDETLEHGSVTVAYFDRNDLPISEVSTQLYHNLHPGNCLLNLSTYQVLSTATKQYNNEHSSTLRTPFHGELVVQNAHFTLITRF